MEKIVEVKRVTFIKEGCATDDHYRVSGIDGQGRPVEREVFFDRIIEESPAVILALQPHLAGKNNGDLFGKLWG